MSALLSQLKRGRFSPSDPILFDKVISSISCVLASQTSMAATMSDFLVSKRRESYRAHVSLPISGSQKRELRVSPCSGSSLFDQELLEKASGQVKEDTFISSSLSLAKLASAKSGGKRKVSSSSGSSQGVSSLHYTSPLEFPRAVFSGYGKRSASLSCGGGGKRVRSGRGVSPTPGSCKGFRKYEPYPCPLTIGSCLSLHWQAWRDRGVDPWLVEVLWWGYRLPFCSAPHLSKEPIPFSTYAPSSIRVKALEQEVLSLVEKGVVELAPLPSPWFYSRLFVVMKASGSCRPVIDLSTLNLRVLKSPFPSVRSPLDEARGLDGLVRSSGRSLASSWLLAGFFSSKPCASVSPWSHRFS